MVIYTTIWENNGVYAYADRGQAVDKIEEISGKTEQEWECDNGSYDKYGNSVLMYEAELND